MSSNPSAAPVNATSIGGIAISGTAAAGNAIVASSPSAAAWANVTNLGGVTISGTPAASSVLVASGASAAAWQGNTASVNIKPANPAATASATLVMMGFGSTAPLLLFTPSTTGNVLVVANSYFTTLTGAVTGAIGWRYGVNAGPATTVAAGSNGGTISGIAAWANPSAGVLAVASTAGYATSGTIYVAASGSTVAQVTYTGIAGNTFTGCAYVTGSASGTVATGGAVTGAPQNGSPVVGTRFGTAGDPSTRAASVGPYSSQAFADILALTGGTQYWLDAALSTTNGSDSAQMQNASVSLQELLY